jgi:hypothetical protein
MQYTPPSSPGSDAETEHPKSVMFAPLSPTSSRRLSRVRQTHQDNLARSSTAPLDSTSASSPLDTTSDDESYREPQHHHHRRRRRNSDPGSSDPLTDSIRDRRQHAARTASPIASDDTESLPDRFDSHNRRIDHNGDGGASGGPNEMVERLVSDFTGVLDGRKSWKDMLRGLAESSQGGAAGEGSSRRRR